MYMHADILYKHTYMDVAYPYPFRPVKAAMETHVTIQRFVVFEHATTFRALYRLSRSVLERERERGHTYT